MTLLCGAARFELLELAAVGCVDNDSKLDCVGMTVDAARLKLVKLPTTDDCEVAEDIVVDTAAFKLVELPVAEI